MSGFTRYVLPEVRALLVRIGIAGPHRGRGILTHVALLAVFGVWLPWMKGIEFLDSVVLAAYTCLGILFAGPVAAQAFAEGSPPSKAVAMARVAVAVLYGESVAVAFLLSALATVYATLRQRLLFAPDWVTIASAGALGLTASIALAAAAGWMTLRFSAGAARAAQRVLFLLLLLLFFFRSRWLPDVAGTAALVVLVLAVLMVLMLRAQLERAQ